MAGERREVQPDAMARPGGHYSHAVVGAGLVFVAGQLPIAPGGSKLADASFEAQATQTLANVAAALQAAGSGVERLLQVRVYVTDIDDWPELEDGWVVHAPVGSLAANPYGLHEVHGNVSEWCRDGYDNYSAMPALDPVTPWAGATHRARRGGSFGVASPDARSADRGNSTPVYQDGNLGLRPARGISMR